MVSHDYHAKALLFWLLTGIPIFCSDCVFSEDTSNDQVYDVAAKHIVSSAVSGMNGKSKFLAIGIVVHQPDLCTHAFAHTHLGTIFAYGQTASGKTFTMQGAPCSRWDGY
jgi:hypothetical protein